MSALAFFKEKASQSVLSFVSTLHDAPYETQPIEHIDHESAERFRQRARTLLRVVEPSVQPDQAIFSPPPPEAFVRPPIVARPSGEAIELPIAVRVKALELQRRQQVLLATANQSLPVGCKVMAWSVVPLELFQSELGRFLMIACDFHAHGLENTMLLPIMPAGAQHLNLPRHPLETVAGHLELATTRISPLRDRVAVEHKRAMNALQSGDLKQLLSRTDSKTRYCKELTTIVESLAKSLLQNDVIENHRAQFGSLIATS